MKIRLLLGAFLAALFLSSCKHETLVSFPPTQAEAESVLEQLEYPWKLEEIQSWNESHLVVHLKNEEDISYVLDFNGREGTNVKGLRINIVRRLGKPEGICSGEEWKALRDLVEHYYGAERKTRKLLNTFEEYWKAVPVNGGNRILWSASEDSVTMQVSLQYSDETNGWHVLNIQTVSAERKEERRKALWKTRETYMPYYPVTGLQEMKDTDAAEESFFEITGILSDFQYQMDFPEELSDVSGFPAGVRGFTSGKLQTGDECEEVWVWPGVEESKKERTMQLQCLGDEKVIIVIDAIQ